MTEVQRETFNVSAAHPDKVVVNGVDLVNRAELSASQNRELQRYIDSHSHLLGFYNRPKDEKEGGKSVGEYAGGRYDTASLSRLPRNSNYDADSTRGTQSLNRIGSPYSEYGGKRKGVSFADGIDSQRARSHSPSHGGRSSGYGSVYSDPYDSLNRSGSRNDNGKYDANRQRGGNTASPYSTGDRGFGPKSWADQSLRSRTESPSTPFKWAPYKSYEGSEERRSVEPPLPSWLKDRGLTSAYSTLERHPDNYNRYDTERYRSRTSRSSHEKDEEIKFSSYGDRLGSGIELTRKRWTGGELITDPTYLQKSLRPRRMYYSPIGDGVVAADGIELKRGPPDLSPRVHVTHERVVEHDRGRAGRRVYEHTWDTGGRPSGNDDGNNGRGGWPNGNGLGREDKGPRYPFDDDSGWPKSASRGPSVDPFGTLNSGDGYPRSDRATPLSLGSDGFPREGWTRTFITNPRELINQYGTETLTTIFDLEDHTPRTLTTVKETLTPVEAAAQ
ncbi:hypothetical protein M3Y94_00316000 [Aphelenchoides besseyi]|nr:hypothetical protein M3Y94_00316000 [Aphelenchoides besseyi]KAI6235689.1 hypothetical protein M3Y95_00078200 [Aphelenchoides besseyi]